MPAWVEIGLSCRTAMSCKGWQWLDIDAVHLGNAVGWAGRRRLMGWLGMRNCAGRNAVQAGLVVVKDVSMWVGRAFRDCVAEEKA
jgi:hypothetical protein